MTRRVWTRYRSACWPALSLGLLATVAAAGAAGTPGGAGAPAPAGGPIQPQVIMGYPLLELTEEQSDRFDRGREAFFMPIRTVDGLGPVLNKVRCVACHFKPLAGGSSNQKVTRFGHTQDGVFDPLEDLGGSLLQRLSISDNCAEEIPPEANVVTERVTNGAMGYGLIEAIPDDAILALEQDPPGVSGRAHIVQALEAPGIDRVGRFGWKAQVATILTFSADAARNEIGFSNRLIPTDPDPNGNRPPDLGDCDTVPDPEDGPDEEGFHFIDRVTDYQRYLAAPPQTPRSGMLGEPIFMAIGCADCHHPAFTTSDDPGLEAALRNRPIRPYSDFLLHDMGAAGDGIAQGDASTTELRTPPLWGLWERPALWHDGRFEELDFNERVISAIEEHGAPDSESLASHAAWTALGEEDRASLLRFLASLGQNEFDEDSNGIIVINDFVDFHACFTGPGEHYTPEDRCSIHDIDQDGDVDLDDYASFRIAYTDELQDCNENGETDIDDILLGRSLDADGNGVPDECEQCPADLDGDDVVGFEDILIILDHWGPCPFCEADIDESHFVDFEDLLIVLAAWGPCP